MRTVGISVEIDMIYFAIYYSHQSCHPCVTFLALNTLILRAIQDLGEACGNKGLIYDFRNNNQLSKV